MVDTENGCRKLGSVLICLPVLLSLRIVSDAHPKRRISAYLQPCEKISGHSDRRTAWQRAQNAAGQTARLGPDFISGNECFQSFISLQISRIFGIRSLMPFFPL